MRYTQWRAVARLDTAFVMLAMTMVTACGDPMSAGDGSSFEADIRGARNERVTGSATASNGGAWARESVVQVTIPSGGTFSGIILSGSDQKTAISIVRAGTELPAGSHRIYRIPVAPGTPTPIFTAAYVVRRDDGLQIFMADSGTVSIVPAGSRLTGSFTLYANRYDVVAAPTPGVTNQVLKPIGSGNTPTTITGSFDAGRR